MAGGTTITTTGVLYINGQQVENTFNNLRRVTNTLERDLRNLTPGTQEFVDTTERLNQSRQRFQALRTEINGTRQAVQEATTSGVGFVQIFTGNVAADFFSNATSKVIEWGTQLKERVEELVAIKRNLSTIDENLKGGALDKASADVKSISDTYGKGVEEIIAAVKGLNAQTGDTGKSLNLIKQGFLAGADASGEMLTQLKEYPTMMNDAKISAEEMIAIMAQSEKMGIYDDKGIDALKEGMLRVREGTKNTVDAMKGLGIDTDEVYKKISSGAMSYFDVLKIVSGKLKETGADSRITGTAIADIFGGPGEDAGYKYLSQLQEINTNLNDLTASTDENVLAKNKELEANEKLNNIWVQLTGTASMLNRMYSSLKIGMADLLSYTFGIKESKLSDEYLKQSTRLDMLNIKLNASNISQGEKLRLYQQLKTEFPNHFKNLDLERMKHNEIAQAIRNASNEMRKKYQLQALQETVDEKGGDFKDASSKVNNSTRIAEDNIQKAIQKIPSLKNIKGKSGTTGETLALMYNYLERNQEIEGNSLTLRGDLRNALSSLNSTIEGKNKAYSNLNKEIKFQQKQTKDLGLGDVVLDENPINTPSKDTDASAKAALEKEAKKAAEKSANDREKAAKDKAKADEKDKKDKEKELADIEKAETESHKKLLDLYAEFENSKAELLQDSLEKESQKEVNRRNQEEKKLLEDIQNLEKRKSESKSSTEKEDIDKSVNTLHKINEQKEEAHRFKMLEIQQKYDSELFKKLQDSQQKKIDEERRLDEEEIIGISSLAEAKEKLKNNEYLHLTDTELNNIQTLEDAKTALREEANRKMLAAQLVALEQQQQILNQQLEGMTGPAAEKLKEDLDALKQKITSVKSAIDGGNTEDATSVTEENKSQKDSVDVLGFSASQWEESFENLDTTAGKIKFAQMAVQALGNAFQAFANLQSALNEKEMAKFDKSQSSKKKELLKQLNEGLINQEEYHSALELLDAQRANREAEMAYKQAKLQRAIQISSAIASTALGVISALTMQPWTWGNIAAAAIVGVMGGVQIATIASQPLPEKPSFATGGFTGSGFGAPDASGYKPAGVVHENEWVAPEWMMEDPKTAQVISYLESVRVGKSKAYATGGFVSEDTVGTSQPVSETSINTAETLATLKSVQELLQYLRDNGVEAWMIEDAENGKKIKRAINKFEKIENAAAGK